MNMGFHYNLGIRVGYNISFSNILLSNVCSKDVARIKREIKQSGYQSSEIKTRRVTFDSHNN